MSIWHAFMHVSWPQTQSYGNSGAFMDRYKILQSMPIPLTLAFHTDVHFEAPFIRPCKFRYIECWLMFIPGNVVLFISRPEQICRNCHSFNRWYPLALDSGPRAAASDGLSWSFSHLTEVVSIIRAALQSDSGNGNYKYIRNERVTNMKIQMYQKK